MIDSNQIQTLLARYGSEEGHSFDIESIPGEIPTYSIVVGGREEMPIYVSSTDEEILCICHIFDEDELKPDSVAEMHEAMLSMNLPMPLSSFGKIATKYVIFGALSAKSDMDELAHELSTLSDNSIDAIEAFSDYLK